MKGSGPDYRFYDAEMAWPEGENQMEFQHAGESYTFMAERGYWVIDGPDRSLVTIYMAETSLTPTEELLKLIITCYEKGRLEGTIEGYSEAQSDMRRVLGIKA